LKSLKFKIIADIQSEMTDWVPKI